MLYLPKYDRIQFFFKLRLIKRSSLGWLKYVQHLLLLIIKMFIKCSDDIKFHGRTVFSFNLFGLSVFVGVDK